MKIGRIKNILRGEQKAMRQYERLADVIRRFEDTEFLATSIENITEEQGRDIETVDDLTDFLEEELSYAYE